jgi:hypothetical protein
MGPFFLLKMSYLTFGFPNPVSQSASKNHNFSKQAKTKNLILRSDSLLAGKIETGGKPIWH